MFGTGAGGFGNFMNAFQTLSGAMMARRGAQMEAAGYRQAANTTLELAKYNNSLVDFNLRRSLNDMRRQIMVVSSTQRANAAASGFAISGGSFSSVMTETLNTFALDIKRQMMNSEIEKQKNTFEAQSEAAAMETRARSAEFRGRQGMMQSIPTILSSFGSLFGAQ